MTPSDLIALASLGVSCVAFCLSLLALRRSDHNTSAQTITALTVGFRECWKEYLKADAAFKEFELAELFNLLEVASATYLDKAVHGKGRKILRDYLVAVIELAATDPTIRRHIEILHDKPDTFEFLKQFAKEMRRSGHLAAFNTLMFPGTPHSKNGATE